MQLRTSVHELNNNEYATYYMCELHGVYNLAQGDIQLIDSGYAT
jgi:hypothetical protein